MGTGGPGSTGHPCFQGFDLFYGYLCQRVAHNYYPTHLWHNHDVDVLGNRQFTAHQTIDAAPSDESLSSAYSGNVYAPDRMIGQALEFITANREKPFFYILQHPFPMLRSRYLTIRCCSMPASLTTSPIWVKTDTCPIPCREPDTLP